MHLLKAILIFYQKLIVPALALSVLIALISLGIAGDFSFSTIGVSYIVLGLLFQYFIYEIRNPNEYYFYYNIGLSKPTLWAATFILNLLIGMVFILL